VMYRFFEEEQSARDWLNGVLEEKNG
jgi:hypothetical protein